MTQEDQDKPADGEPSPSIPPTGEGGAQEAPVLTVEDRFAKLETEKKDLRERMLRIAAEFENWKKRSRKEQTDAETKAREGVLREVLEVVDNLERATLAGAMTNDPKAIQEGIALVLRLFLGKLERWDVRPLEAKGKPFDPRLHDAISQAPSQHVPPGTVINEVVKGYNIGDRLLRPATVIVSVSPAPPEGEPPAGTNGAGAPTDSEEPAAKDGDA